MEGSKPPEFEAEPEGVGAGAEPVGFDATGAEPEVTDAESVADAEPEGFEATDADLETDAEPVVG